MTIYVMLESRRIPLAVIACQPELPSQPETGATERIAKLFDGVFHSMVIAGDTLVAGGVSNDGRPCVRVWSSVQDPPVWETCLDDAETDLTDALGQGPTGATGSR